MSEGSDRRTAEAYVALVGRAVAMIREHGEAVCLSFSCPHDLDSMDDEELACLTFDGDTGTLHFSGYEGYTRTLDFDARCLWSARRIAAVKRALEQRRAEERAQLVAREEARQLAQYEALRRKFDPTGDLRADLRIAIALHEKIAEEDAAR